MCRNVRLCTLVALHCCKAHSKSIGKMENLTPCKIVTTENFILKLGVRDYVENITHYINFHVHRFSGGFSTNRWNITLLWLFSCPVLSFFSRSHAQLEPRDRFSRFMAQMTWFSPRTRTVYYIHCPWRAKKNFCCFICVSYGPYTLLQFFTFIL